MTDQREWMTGRSIFSFSYFLIFSLPHRLQLIRILLPRIPLRYIHILIIINTYIMRILEYFIGLVHFIQHAVFINRLSASKIGNYFIVLIQYRYKTGLFPLIILTLQNSSI